ncbi:adenylate/guanylate cyclase domain-containing protein [Nitratireductor sp. XY-223]|uniref:adenylate/guanylate cyclase domain-containing protein n=1 Tax=Nitratireductor sp. XY-223 TaxID=2561926 RepID=UPI0010AAD55A|nr:adenylate/guanylate cyclase domain-containing protein [Nitratireductor sp. XY-223]
MTDIGDWLEALGLGKYVANFAESEVELSDLAELSDEDLIEIGLPLGPRRRILKALRSDASQPAAPAEVAESDPEAPDRPTVAERRQLTVMFCDLVGSTELSTRLDPEEYRETMRAYQDMCAGVITRYDGYVAKFMGDGVLAYFGWPRGHENDAERALSAGLGLARNVGTISAPGLQNGSLKVRIGVATGPVVVGDIIGEGAAQEAAVTGETPNLAARLQELAPPNSVVVSHNTQALAGGLFDYEPMGEVSLKGIPQPVDAFRVTGERAIESRFEARSAEILPMVGRDQELALLLERWAKVEGGEGQGVLLVGEAGIGKSRIVRGLIDGLSDRAYTRIHYQCSPLHTGSALWPAIQQLRFAASMLPTDSQSDQKQKLRNFLNSSNGSADDLALVAELIGVQESEDLPFLELPPQIRRSRTLEMLLGLLTKQSRIRPVLFVMEDVHWIDPTTLELLELCLDTIAETSVMMLMTSRPDNQPELAAHPYVTRLTLNRLGRSGLHEIVARLGGGNLPVESVNEILARTDGVPLYVEELTKAVLETGETAIPASLHDSLMSRLDRFPDVKEVAQTAACIGREFDLVLLQQIVDGTDVELDEALQELVAAQLVFRRGTASSGGYIFKHALVRDAAYESMLKKRRQAIHTRLVNVLERQDDATQEVVARHAEAAGLMESAIEHWALAAAQSMKRPAYKEAIASYQSAIALCRNQGDDIKWKRRELELQVEVGQALIANLGYQAPATVEAFESALLLADRIDDPERLVRSIFGLWAARYICNVPSYELADRMAAATNVDIDRGAKCVSYRMLALENFHMAQYRNSLDLVGKALEIYNEEEDRDLALRYGHDPRVAATNYKAWNLWYLGFPVQAKAAAEQSLTWALERDHPNTIGLSQCFGVCLTNIWLGDTDRVARAAKDVLVLAEEKSLELWNAWGRIYRGWARFQGNQNEGFDDLAAGLEFSARIGAVRLEPFHFGLAAQMYSKIGQHDEADHFIQKAFSSQELRNDVPFEAELHRLRAAVSLNRNARITDAVEHDLLRALEVAKSQNALSLELRASRDLALIRVQGGDRPGAYDLLSGVRRRFTEGDDMPELRLVDSILADLQ